MLKFDKFLRNSNLRKKGFREKDDGGGTPPDLSSYKKVIELSANVSYTVNNVTELTNLLNSLKWNYYKSSDGNDYIIYIYFNSGTYDFGTGKYNINQIGMDENVKMYMRSTTGLKSDVILDYTKFSFSFDGRGIFRYFTLKPKSNINGNGINIVNGTRYMGIYDLDIDVSNCIKVNNNYSIFVQSHGYGRYKNINIINGITDSTGINIVQASGQGNIVLEDGFTGNVKTLGYTTFGDGNIVMGPKGFNNITIGLNAVIKSPFVKENTGSVDIDGFPGPKLTEVEKSNLQMNYVYEGYLIYNIDKERPEIYNETTSKFEPISGYIFNSNTGNTLYFDKNYIYGGTTPLTGDLTVNTTGALEGNYSQIIHNDIVEPNINGVTGFVGDQYITGVDNLIIITYYSDTNIIYSIQQIQ